MHLEAITPDQWERLRELRLRALRESSQWFAARVEGEELKSESEWRALCSEESWRTFWKIIAILLSWGCPSRSHYVVVITGYLLLD
jgi:hypothetical protein